MADGESPQALQGSDIPPIQAKRRSSDSNTGGKKKAKTKHLSTKEPSKTAEREASRRHQALEQEFSKAQRLRSREAELVPPASLASSPYEPSLVPSYQAPRAGSPQGGTEQVSLFAPRQHIPTSPLPGPSISPANISTHTPETTAAGVPSAERSLWAQQFQSFMHQAFNKFMSSSLAAGPSQVSPSPPLPVDRTGRPQSAGSGISETSSQFGETESVDLVTTEGPMSEDEEVTQDPTPTLGLFDPNLFKSLLLKACTTANLASEQEPKPSTSSTQESNPLFVRKVVEEKQVPCPADFHETVEKEWTSLATLPSPSSTEKRLYNVSSAFSSLLEVPTVDAPLTSLFSTSWRHGRTSQGGR
ncbi:actin cytoskeleton-regulatory complex protein PAN1-like [Crotalus tigris]|uniref:actin cytoskeleton-regulatory complex protein PAN1-like n=1 Tax=Crotalus tigris TaxID=88082 RepID=UPI00192F4CB8|nr:actin cytoskeleton-regulatory complex protein PAN1-like [Crotalus tigris]